MTKIFIRTHAYNAKDTLPRAVDSVLGQTYTHFSYYLCENGSLDGGESRRIVEKYAHRDKRIIPFYNERNRVWDGNEAYLDLPHHIDDDDYYCELDADDEYMPAFFEEMLAFMKEHDLDIACCGSEFINAAEPNQVVGTRLLKQNLIIEGQGFVDLFPVYHNFMRTCWAKIYKGSILRHYITRYQDDPNYPVAYGGDTYVNTRLFRESKRVGILAKPLHKYYVSPKSVSYSLHPQRVACDRILHEDAIEYLQHFGEISPRNRDFLYVVYLNALKDTLTVLLQSKAPNPEKLKGLFEMFNSEHTKQLAALETLGLSIGRLPYMLQSRKELFLAASNYLLSLSEVPDELVEDFCNVGEFVSAAADFANGWIFFNKLRIRWLMQEQRTKEAEMKLNELEELLPNDADLFAIREELHGRRD